MPRRELRAHPFHRKLAGVLGRTEMLADGELKLPSVVEVIQTSNKDIYHYLEEVDIDDAKVLSLKIQEWENFYNYHRPCGEPGGQSL